MLTYPVGVAVSVIIPLIDYNGAPFTPTGLSYRVTDENDVELNSGTLPLVDGMTEATITVDAVANGLAGARVVYLDADTASGSFSFSKTYRLVDPMRLQVLLNTFQTYVSAELLAADMPNLNGWTAIEDINMRQAALSEAYARLTKLGYRVRRPQDIDQSMVGFILNLEEIIEPRAWTVMTMDRWNRLPDYFKHALRRAQVIEANELLSGDLISSKRRSGLMSETIGESSQMFRPGKPMSLGVSTATLEALSGFVQIRMTLTRS